jgi:hypothetical protein
MAKCAGKSQETLHGWDAG